MTRLRALTPVLLLAAATVSLAGQAGGRGETPARIDYLTFAQGAIPIAIDGGGAPRPADFEAAVRVTDGDPTPFVVLSRAGADGYAEFVYELPAPTTFDRFAVPTVTETPSPTTTFTRQVDVLGSAVGPDQGFVRLASATLQTHGSRDEVTELAIEATPAVRWVRLRLSGGIDVRQAQSFFEFSEIVGNGTQGSAPMVTGFSGAWRTQGNRMRLAQEGPVVTGCYDTAGDLTGTVSGNILRATGTDRNTKTPSAFILGLTPDGALRGVRSANGAPFRLYTAAPAAGTAVSCGAPPPPVLGCGSIIHSITFDFDSAEIRSESEAVLAALFDGLRTDASAAITIEGHTSSEGSDDYNRGLSERRARAVVDDLVRRGLPRTRLAAAGIGESRPIAPNTDESGRSMNRRVEVRCR